MIEDKNMTSSSIIQNNYFNLSQLLIQKVHLKQLKITKKKKTWHDW